MNQKVSAVYCVNPVCLEPKNLPSELTCQSCGSKLLLYDRYQILGILGKGGFGATFAAIDTTLPSEPVCVVKQLRPASEDPNVYNMAKELFIREAQTLGRVGGHPQVPRLLDYFEDNQQFYLVQEFVKGNNLHQQVKKRGPFTEAGVKQFLTEILPILNYIHSQKVIHRDIKPANIIRREQDKQLVLIDFGAVKNEVNSVVAKNSPNTTLTQFAIGTAGFAPPEQLAMRPVYASDIYALGVTCIYLLTGKSPKDIETDTTTGELLWSEFAELSDPFARVLKTMVEVSVKRRYKNAREVLDAMEALPYAETLAEAMLVSNTNPRPTAKELVDKSAGVQNIATPNYQAKSPVRTPKLNTSSILRLYGQNERDFTQQQLVNLSLSNATIPGIKFSGANLAESNFHQSDLSQANFEKAKLTRAIFRDSLLRGAQLSQSDLQDADLRDADLTGSNLRSANLKGANFCGANLENAQVRKEQLVQAKTNWLTIMPSGRRGLW